jgi:hypothetical protein
VDGGVNAEQAEAWQAVCAALTTVYPDWLDGSKRGLDCAVKAIQELASKASTPAPYQALPDAAREPIKAAGRPQTSNVQIRMLVNGEVTWFDGSWLKELAQ